MQPVGGTKSYMKALPGVWPIDLEKWTVTVLGEGEENIAWTLARGVAKALVRLVEVPQWEENTYVCGEIGTWNEAIAKIEKFYGELNISSPSPNKIPVDPTYLSNIILPY